MAVPQSPRQTQGYLQQLFAERGIAPRSRLGQNFLIDLNIQRLLVETARLERRDVALEVGAGTGGLTAELARYAGQVLAVEIDPRYYALAAEAVAGCTNVTLVHADVLKSKNRLNPQLLEQLHGLMGALGPDAQFKLVANLPYSAATPVIANLLGSDPAPASMSVTIQQELADRLAARPRTKDYGALSVWVQGLAKVRLVRRLPPSVFWPRPKVFSAIVQIVPQPGWRARISELGLFHELVRRAFLHRRKKLSNTLSAEFREQFTKPEAEHFLEAQGVSPDARPEAVTVRQWIELGNAYARVLGRAGSSADTPGKPGG
jgi:16S rRNA (adenine1518-N6/adenine1519-N6)-dimethyltransferase